MTTNTRSRMVQCWNGVVVDLSTHDAGGVTSLDVQMARKMNGIAD